ncbi:MAG: hypothetical protein K6F04_00310 [bacterium]|nr:hypothetical protein [bacterium]
MAIKKVAKKNLKKASKTIKEVEKKVKSTVNKVKDSSPEVISTAKTYFKSAEKQAKKIKISKFITDAVYMLLHPVKYFTSIEADGNYENAIVKVLMYGLITAGIKILFNIANITLLGTVSALILMPIYAMLITFALAGVMLFFSYLAKGEMNFETALKAVASCIFMYPLSYIAYHIAFSYWILFFFSIMIDLYIVFLIYTATTYCLKGEKGIANVIFCIFTLFIILIHFSASGAMYVSTKNPKVGFKHHFAKMQKQQAPVVNIQ